MYCSKCGKELPADSAFCSKCGNNLKAGTVPLCPVPSVTRRNRIVALVVVFFAVVLFIAGFILIDRLTSNHPEADPSGTAAAMTTDETGNEDSSEHINNIADKNIIGLWSTEGPSGALVDPVTGYATGSIYNGEWYLFKSDGTYRYVIISSGQIVNGGVVCEGKFTVNNGEILLTHVKESWYPNPAATGQKDSYENKRIDDITIPYQYGDDKNTLIIDDLDYFTRVEE